MNPNSPNPLIREKAPQILDLVKKSSSILLHCHPSPDPDSLGSTLSTKFVLESMGKKVTIIKGDSEIPEAFMHFPGAKDIVMKNFTELDLGQFDLFLVVDCSSLDRITRFAPVVFPSTMKVAVIDHHATAEPFGDVNLIIPTFPSTCELLYEIFREWNVQITPDTAKDLFIGMYTDTGGFKYGLTTFRTFEIAAELAKITSGLSEMIATMENSHSPASLTFKGAVYSSLEVVGGIFALGSVPNSFIVEKKIPVHEAGAGSVVSSLLSVKEWQFVAIIVETEPHIVKASFRSKDSEKYDVSKLAAALGGGGHKAAAACVLEMSFEDAKRLVVEKAKELFHL